MQIEKTPQGKALNLRDAASQVSYTGLTCKRWEYPALPTVPITQDPAFLISRQYLGVNRRFHGCNTVAGSKYWLIPIVHDPSRKLGGRMDWHAGTRILICPFWWEDGSGDAASVGNFESDFVRHRGYNVDGRNRERVLHQAAG